MIMTSWSAPIEDFMKAVSSIHFPWISLLEKKNSFYHIISDTEKETPQ